MNRKEQLLARAMLLQEVSNDNFVPYTNLVNVHVGDLQRKVDLPHKAPMMYSPRGMGLFLHAPS